MIGTNPTLPYPQLGDTYTQAISKIAAWLSAIGVSLGDRATPSALNINTALDFGGNAATNITSVQLAAGNTPNVAGSLFYNAGEFYAIDATGTVQLTANGQLNAASVGGIGGDYGGVNPAQVVYDNASGQYRFYVNGGTSEWAELAAAKLLLEGAAGSVELGVDAALAANRIINFKSLPASGVGLLVYNAATSTIEDASVTPVTDDVTLAGDVSVTGSLTTTADLKHTDAYIAAIPMNPAVKLAGCGFQTGHEETILSTTTNWEYQTVSHGAWGLRVGDRITRVVVHFPATASGTYTVNLRKRDSAGNVSIVDTHAFSGVGGFINDGFDVTTPSAISEGEKWFVQVLAANTGDILTDLHVKYDHP